MARTPAAFLRYISTWDMTRLAPGEGHYAAACRDDGGILDDIYVFCLDAERYLVVVNASNAPKMKAWLEEHIEKWDARLVDRHASTAMIAVQGPQALGRLRDAHRRRLRRLAQAPPLRRDATGAATRSSPPAPATPARTASSS